jgi:hypothetical protein
VGAANSAELRRSPKAQHPTGLYRFRYVLPNRDYVLLTYSRLERDQTYVISSAAACADGEVDNLDTLPCQVQSLQVAGPEEAKPDKPIRLGVNAFHCERAFISSP